MFEPFICKDQAFQNEKEIRLLFNVLGSQLNHANYDGLNVPVGEFFRKTLTVITHPSAQADEMMRLKMQIGTEVPWIVEPSKFAAV